MADLIVVRKPQDDPTTRMRAAPYGPGLPPQPEVPDDVAPFIQGVSVPDVPQTQADYVPDIVEGAMGDARAPSLAPKPKTSLGTKVLDTLSAIAPALSTSGNALEEAAGAPWQAKLAQERSQFGPKLAMETALRKSQIEMMGGYHAGQLKNAAAATEAKRDISNQKTDSTMRLKGYVPDNSGGYRPMNEDEILTDPFLSRNRDLAQAALASKQAGTDLAKARTDALMNPNNPTLQLKAKEIESRMKMAEAQLGLRQHALARLDTMQGYNALMNTGMDPLTGESLADAQARGAAPRTLADANGNPVPYKQLSTFSPTSQMKNVAAQGNIAAQGIPNVIKEIDELGDSLGPVSGRWNEYIQGRVGLDNPAFAGLRSDLLMVSSAVALAHARGRLPENLREEFDSMINAPQQDPENIKAVLSHILPWMQNVAKMPSEPVPMPPMTGGSKVIEYEKGPDGRYRPKGTK